ncbi:MAG: hypothetical protein B7Z82_09040 [Halothiobacillus sp. 20-54-6]|nr:MAG: hypothetical protein B7Z82_09040 [Halothiobacillus sp. 20-54-6]
MGTSPGITNVIGVIDDASGEYRIQPTTPRTYPEINPRKDRPPIIPNAMLSTGSFNVLNDFTGISSWLVSALAPPFATRKRKQNAQALNWIYSEEYAVTDVGDF